MLRSCRVLDCWFSCSLILLLSIYRSCVLYVPYCNHFLLDYDGLDFVSRLKIRPRGPPNLKCRPSRSKTYGKTIIQHSTSIMANRIILGRSTTLTTFLNDRYFLFWTINTLGSAYYRDFFAVFAGCPVASPNPGSSLLNSNKRDIVTPTIDSGCLDDSLRRSCLLSRK